MSIAKLFAGALALLAAFSPPLLASSVSIDVNIDVGQATWSYTVSNTAPSGQEWIASLLLTVSAPIVVLGTPTGWDYQTDFSTYVLWFNADLDPPFPNDIGPGASIGGFVLRSLGGASGYGAFEAATWNHDLFEPGTLAVGVVQVPSVAVPEPATVQVTVGSLLIAWVCGRYRLRRSKSLIR